MKHDVARYAPHKRFPVYAFLPGRDPHPTRDPRGHSFAHAATQSLYFPPENWSENEEYLFGVDLYNHGFLWEAHEAWEGLWHRAKHDEDQAALLQGLIQCAAASLKVAMEQPNGLTKLAAIGTARLEGVVQHCGPRFMGLDLVRFVAAFRTFAVSEPESADLRPRIELA